MTSALHIILIFEFLLFTLTFNEASAQPSYKAQISGRVVNHNNGEPLSYVNVFFTNTTKGSTTDKDGFYWIKGIPFGYYELVVSMMGFEIQSKPIKLTKPGMEIINFRLRPKVIEMEEVIVEAPDAKEWRKNLRTFESELFGKTDNAYYCKILNPLILDFEVRESPYLFKATTKTPLEIINLALGYRIYVVSASLSLTSYRYKFKGNLLFKELEPKNEKEKKTWTRERLRSYRGSFRHFLNSLVDLRSNDEGFDVWKNDKDRLIEPNLYKEWMWDKFEEPRRLLSIFSSEQSSFEMKLHFMGPIRVVYMMERNSFHDKPFQISFLELAGDTVAVTTSGHGFGYPDFVKHGYWGIERLAEELPMDYVP